jgi:hypothetical protein
MDFELENNKKEEPGMKDRSNRVRLRRSRRNINVERPRKEKRNYRTVCKPSKRL